MKEKTDEYDVNLYLNIYFDGTSRNHDPWRDGRKVYSEAHERLPNPSKNNECLNGRAFGSRENRGGDDNGGFRSSGPKRRKDFAPIPPRGVTSKIKRIAERYCQTEGGTADRVWRCVPSREKERRTGSNTGLTREIPPPSPNRRIAFLMRKLMAEHIEEMLDKGVIQESSSPWSSPVVLVTKKDGGDGNKLRFCTDFRALNAATVRDFYPLPNIQDTLDWTGPNVFRRWTWNRGSGRLASGLRTGKRRRSVLQIVTGNTCAFHLDAPTAQAHFST